MSIPSPSHPSGIRVSTRALRSGFTLVEILIAIALLGLVLAAIYSSWTAILRASKVGLEAAASVQRSRIAIRMLEDSLGSAQAFAANPQYYAFVAENGNEASFSFVARLAKDFPRSGKFGDLNVRRLTFSVEPAPDSGRQLVLRQQTLLMEMDVDEKEHPLVLAKNVKDFELGFWDTRLSDWVDEWTQTNQLPPLVKITLSVADHPYSSQAQQEVTRIVSLPAVMVQPVWQMPRGMGGPPGQVPPGGDSLRTPKQPLPKPEDVFPGAMRTALKHDLWQTRSDQASPSFADRVGFPRRAPWPPQEPGLFSPSERGIALIMVMIAIFVLTVLAGGFAYSMKVETKLAYNANSEAELEWLGRSGVEYARWILAQQLLIPQEPYDALNQVWAGGPGGIGTSNSPLAEVQSEVRLGNGSFTWTITDLERKANINTADERTLNQAIMVMGLDAGDQATIVGSILDWIDPDDVTRPQGAESDFYHRMDPPYDAKNGPIDDLSELLLVHGIAEAPELYWGGVATNHYPSRFQPRNSRFGSAGQPRFIPSGWWTSLLPSPPARSMSTPPPRPCSSSSRESRPR